MMDLDFEDIFDSIGLLDNPKNDKIEKNHRIVKMLNERGIKIKKPSEGLMAS